MGTGVGTGVGLPVGCDDGANVGKGVGTGVGLPVGCDDGANVGWGVSVGAGLGCAVGNSVGIIVGTAVGCSDGNGVAVGAAVGASGCASSRLVELRLLRFFEPSFVFVDGWKNRRMVAACLGAHQAAEVIAVASLCTAPTNLELSLTSSPA